jgi:hypothetical protein
VKHPSAVKWEIHVTDENQSGGKHHFGAGDYTFQNRRNAMSERTTKLATGLTEEFYAKWGHVCLIYDDEDQRQEIVSKYIAAGLKQGEQVRYFTDTATADEVRAWLSRMGVELPADTESEAFRIAPAVGAYCPSGQFEPQKMIDGCKARYGVAQNAGFTGVRSCGEMSWVYKGLPGSERFLEYEVLLNTVKGDFPHIGMCQYDARVFDGATLFKVLQVHPYMVAQGQIVTNPFFMRPNEFAKRSGIGE